MNEKFWQNVTNSDSESLLWGMTLRDFRNHWRIAWSSNALHFHQGHLFSVGVYQLILTNNQIRINIVSRGVCAVLQSVTML